MSTTPSAPIQGEGVGYDENRADASSQFADSQIYLEANPEFPGSRSHDDTSLSISVGTIGVGHILQEHPSIDATSASSPRSTGDARDVGPPLPITATPMMTSPVGNGATAPDLTTPPLPIVKPPSPSPITASRPDLSITLLLISGVRYQFVLSQSFLKSHSVTGEPGEGPLKDPLEMSVSKLKECIWKEWRDEWEQRPASALFIRLIHFGRMLEDKQLLADCRLNLESPNVIHMSIRPAETGDDEITQPSPKGGFGRPGEPESAQRTPTCRCVIL